MKKLTGRFIDLTGQRFARLVVQGRAESDKNGNARWHCQCDCGNVTVSNTWALRKGESGSCGCLNNDIAAARLKTHGLSRCPEYMPWASMIQRCTNPKNTKYALYGGRGIKVCKEWIESFESFHKHVGQRPSNTHTLDRIDNDGDYEPGNVRWATKSQQNSNKRNQHWVVYKGRKMALTEAIREAGAKVEEGTVFHRIARGWPVDKAVETDAGQDRHLLPGPKKK